VPAGSSPWPRTPAPPDRPRRRTSPFAAVVAEVRDTAKRAAQEYGVPITLVTRRGDPFGQLRDVADETKADMVFVGASAQAGQRFVGSIATRLVRLGRWPVVVVP
jgi:nucleotide-binding universal stress UspA family protein